MFRCLHSCHIATHRSCSLQRLLATAWRLLLVYALVSSAYVSTIFARTPSVNEIARTWRARQESIDTARISWTKALFVGSHNPITDNTPAKLIDNTYDPLLINLSVSGDMFRLETPIPSSDGTISQMVHVFNGTLNQMLVTKADGQNHSGAIGAEHYFYDLNNVHLRPAIMFARPLHPRLITLRSDTFHIREQRELIDGRQCVVMAQTRSNSPGLTEIYWLDPDRDFLPLQWQERYNGVTSAMVHIAYERNADGLITPTSWQSSFFDLKGNFREGSQASDVTIDLNEPIDSADFSFTFPEGTVVGDRRHKGEQFVVASDGSLRPLGAGGVSASSFPLARWSMLLVLAVATLVVAIVLWRRKHFGFQGRP